MRCSSAAQTCGVFVVVASLLTPVTGRCEQGSPLTIENAVRLALERSLTLRAAEAEVSAARGDLLGARVVTPHNPEISAEVGVRFSDGEEVVQAATALSQAFEIGRPRRHRINAADAALAATRDRLELQRLRLTTEVRIAFVNAVAAQSLVALALEGAELTNELYRIAEERRNAEAGTDLEVNLAALERAQARRLLIRDRQRETEARLLLSRALSLAPRQVVQLPTELPAVRPVTTTPEALVRTSLEQRLDLSVFTHAHERAAAAVEAARAEAWPDLALEASYELEEGQDHIVGVGFSIPLPFFQRNQGEVARARAEVERAEVEIEAARLLVEREVLTALARYAASLEVVDVLGQETLARSAENYQLLLASFEEGNVGFLEVLLVQREVLAARRDAVEGDVELQRARFELELAVGGEVR